MEDKVNDPGPDTAAHRPGDDGLMSGWIAEVHGLRPTAATTHETAAAAVQAILWSSWGRRLGARAASRICWTDKATRAAARTGGGR